MSYLPRENGVERFKIGTNFFCAIRELLRPTLDLDLGVAGLQASPWCLFFSPCEDPLTSKEQLNPFPSAAKIEVHSFSSCFPAVCQTRTSLDCPRGGTEHLASPGATLGWVFDHVKLEDISAFSPEPFRLTPHQLGCLGIGRSLWE